MGAGDMIAQYRQIKGHPANYPDCLPGTISFVYLLVVEPPKLDPPGVLVFRSWGSAKGGLRWARGRECARTRSCLPGARLQWNRHRDCDL